MSRSVYLDHAATTPTDPRVVEAMMPYFTNAYGNPSSIHAMGRKAANAVEQARERVAACLNAKPTEIVFTSGGSESDNLAVRGAAWAARQTANRAHLVTTPIEHSAVSRTVRQLAEVQGFTYDIVPVDSNGQVSADAFRAVLQPNTALASVMTANNEMGTVQPIAALAGIAHENGTLFHTDAVQAGGQLLLDVQSLDVDLLSLSAHKFYGPKGIGVLFVRDGIAIYPAQTGGGQEHALRAGTHNTPAIVGLATALELAHEEHAQRTAHYQAMRDALIAGICARIDGATLTGHPQERLPNHASFAFEGISANTLLIHLDTKGVAVSSGSACKVGNPNPSEVLLAMGYDRDTALSGLRLTVGTQTTLDDVTYAVDVIAQSVEKLRALNV